MDEEPLKFVLREVGGEPLLCASCDYPAPTAEFDRRQNAGESGPPRLLCEFCSTSMASRLTEVNSADRTTREIWKAAGSIANYLKFGGSGNG